MAARAVAQLFLSAHNVCFTSATMFARSHLLQCGSPTGRPLSNGVTWTAVRFFVAKNFLSTAAFRLSACLLSSSGLDRTASSHFSSSRNNSNAVWLQIDRRRRPAFDSRTLLLFFSFFRIVPLLFLWHFCLNYFVFSIHDPASQPHSPRSNDCHAPHLTRFI